MNIYCITSNPQIDYIKNDLERLGDVHLLNAQKLSAEEVIAQTQNVDILIAGSSGIAHISASLIDQLPNLKFIALLTVGYDWVDIDHAKQKGITISNIKGANAQSVAEHTWGMILDLSKRITEFDRAARNNGAFAFNQYKGKEVFGKTLGVIGLGNIGKKVAHGAKGFDMKVIGVNKSGEKVDGIELVTLQKLLSESDVITVCVPLTDKTENLISENEIEKMKDGVIIVNCAREAIVNKTAIINEIKSGKIFGYGVETAIMKPIPPNDPYYQFPNILVTPHNAFNTEDADRKSYELVLENIRAFLRGNPINIL